MSNETDLDWLARNVHVWCDGANYVCVNHTDGGHVFHEHNRNCAIWFTKDQWLARRAELQNKPSFADHADAKCFVQDGYGNWLKNTLTSSAEVVSVFWRAAPGDGFVFICAGNILGDWRDTLEKRPEEFKPFASIEDNQELSMTQQQVKQDNGWFERGELPPVGIECEAKKYGKEEYYKVVICGAGKHLGLAVSFYEKQKGSGAFTCSSAEYFRPIRTERDELIEIISSSLLVTTEQVADAIIAAGFKLEKKS